MLSPFAKMIEKQRNTPLCLKYVYPNNFSRDLIQFILVKASGWAICSPFKSIAIAFSHMRTMGG